MKNVHWWMVGLLAVAFLTAPAVSFAGDDAGDEEKPAKMEKKVEKERVSREKSGPALRGEYGIIASKLNMTEDQKARLTEIVAKYRAEEKELRAKNAEKAKQLQTDIKAAKEAKDREKVAACRKEMRELEQPMAALREKKNQEVQALLTDEQKVQYKQFNAYRRLSARLRGVKLSDEQKAKVEKIAVASADGLLSEDRKVARQASDEALKKVCDEVLTDEQKAKVKLPRARGPRERKGADKKDAPDSAEK